MGRITRSTTGGNLHPVSKQVEELLLTSMHYFSTEYFQTCDVEGDFIFQRIPWILSR